MNRRAYSRIWRDKQGNKQLITKMSNSHLKNTIKMLERKAKQIARECPFPMFNGEMAQYYAEQKYAIKSLLAGTVYDSLIDELYKRKLEDL